LPGVAVLPPATWPPYFAWFTSACSTRTALQSTSSSSAMSIGSIVLMPWPTSGFLAVIVTMPFSAMLMKAFGESGGGGPPGACASARSGTST
jgi:hypothetical protein